MATIIEAVGWLSARAVCVFFVVCLASVWGALGNVHAGEKIRVAFINPDQAGHPFWDSLTLFMQAAANDLDIDLKVHHAGGGRFRNTELALAAIHSIPKPDYLVYIAQAREVGKILAAAQAAGVKSFTINTDVLPEDRRTVGSPREKFTHWLGHMHPNDVKAGSELAQLLVREAKTSATEQTVGVIGVSGSLDSAAAVDRASGLESGTSKQSGAVLHQVVFSGWAPQEAQARGQWLLQRYPDTTVLWAASDAMALGLIHAARSARRVPGKEVFVGGFDWSDAGLTAIAQGEMTASMGGHFMEGGWAMVLLHDYHRGRDFSTHLGTTVRSEMQAITKSNVAELRKTLGNKQWEAVNFRQFSLVLNPALKHYDFSLKALSNATR